MIELKTSFTDTTIDAMYNTELTYWFLTWKPDMTCCFSSNSFSSLIREEDVTGLSASSLSRCLHNKHLLHPDEATSCVRAAGCCCCTTFERITQWGGNLNVTFAKWTIYFLLSFNFFVFFFVFSLPCLDKCISILLLWGSAINYQIVFRKLSLAGAWHGRIRRCHRLC